LKIFVCIESYLPGTLGGGPVRALANLIDHLHPEHEFFIFTRNHDYLDATEYADLDPNVWHPQTKASVYYSNRPQTERDMLEQIQTVQPDWIYLNGALPGLTRTCLKLRRQESALQAIPVLLAPHGNLSVSALAHHRFRKQGWLFYAKVRGFYNDVIWHAASARESDQIHAVFGEAALIREVPMAPRAPSASDGESVGKLPVIKKAPLLHEEGVAAQRVGVVPEAISHESSAISDPPSDLSHHSSSAAPIHHSSQRKTLSLVYFGRLSPEKNLPFAFQLLKEFAAQHPRQPVVYDLIGAGEPAYEVKLRELSAKLPSTIQINFIGQLSPEALQARLQSQVSSLRSPTSPSHLPTFLPSHTSHYHAMLMPSLTENFSFTVLESLQAGIPVLISDQTPWRGLEEAGVGWDIELEEIEVWCVALSALLHQSPAEHLEQSQRAAEYAAQWAREYSQKATELFRRGV
jgi:glycosyltransferase involved in cell wall biosynthesis